MALAAGTRVGAYEITSALGSGGMGEVYRARDTRLGRDVALKILPEAFAGDSDRRMRFEREARTLAALNHPHIAQIYGVEEGASTGSGLGGLRALVMEFVDGEDLSRRVARGPLPLDEALPLARQLVDALDYAHEHAVLHRDLKPANLKVTADGQLKVLDFGLAKALETGVGNGEPGTGTPADSPTITSPAVTRAGVILGTAAYMAPEQVRGREVDKRVDIWAFGCVLYEWLSGARAFHGETISDTLAAVLKTDPDWTKMPADVAPAIRQLLAHCLQRDPKARLRDIADARPRLQDVAAMSVHVNAANRQNPLFTLAAGALAGALLVATAWVLGRQPVATPQVGPRYVAVPLPVALPDGPNGAVVISADGSTIAYVGQGELQHQLVLTRLTDGSTTFIREPPNPSSLALSPDGRWVAFQSGGRIWRAALSGGGAEILCESGGVYRGGAWGPNGRLVFGTFAGLFEAAGAELPCQVSVAVEGPRETRYLWPQILPAARGTLVTVSGVSDDADGGAIVAIPSGTTERRVVMGGARAGRVTASGHLVFARGAQVLAAPFDPDRLAVTADPVVVIDGVTSGQNGIPLLDVSSRGELVYMPGRMTTSQLTWVTRDGARSPTGAPARSYLPDVRLSPDGRRVLVPVGAGDHFLWAFGLDTGGETRFTEVDAHLAAWSPNGRSVAYPISARRLAIRDLDSNSPPEIVVDSPRNVQPFAWSPDGTVILYSRAGEGGQSELVVLRVSDRTSTTLLRAQQASFAARFSPDGRWVAYVSGDSGRTEVYVTDFPAARMKLQVSTSGGFGPEWARDGRELYYATQGRIMAAAVNAAGSSLAFGRPAQLFDGIEVTGLATPFSVAPDGRFLVVEPARTDGARRRHFTLVMNWFDELQRRVPARPIAGW